MGKKRDDKWALIIYLARTQLGVKPSAAYRWKQRGIVPHKFRMDLLDIADEGKLDLSRADFET